MMRQQLIGIALAIAMGITVQARAGTVILQYGFDATTGAVTTPVIDDSGTGNDGTDILVYGGAGAAPVYSADIPAGNVRNATGIGSVDFTGTNAGLSTAASEGVGSGQGITTATDVFNAGGLTMEVWVKDASSNANPGIALGMAGAYVLGVTSAGDVGFFHGDDVNDLSWTSNVATDSWTHLAAVMETTDPAAMIFDRITAYVNGSAIHSDSYTLPFFLDCATAVGNHQYADWGDYEGLVYEPRVTLGALQPSEFTIVPEPGSFVLFGLSLVGLIGWAVRRKRSV